MTIHSQETSFSTMICRTKQFYNYPSLPYRFSLVTFTASTVHVKYLTKDKTLLCLLYLGT